MKSLQVMMILALLATGVPRAQAQATTGSVVQFEIENFTQYIDDCPNSQLASNPGKLDRRPGPAFERSQGIGDIVSVNGAPFKGTAYETIVSGLRASPSPMAGGAIADSVRTAIIQWRLDFLNPDGTEIGTIHVSGLLGGSPPPGGPKEIPADSSTIIGGTGAFFGVRGYFTAPAAVPVRFTSACEDPGMRRTYAQQLGLGKRHATIYLVPMSQPRIMTTPSGPAVTHAKDFSLVTASKPAAAGEVLSLFATGLGPTRPGVDPGQPFPASPQAIVNSPVSVTVNGQPAEVLAAVGYTGSVDGYQVNFRLPPDAAKGVASIQVSSAWIASTAASITVQ